VCWRRIFRSATREIVRCVDDGIQRLGTGEIVRSSRAARTLSQKRKMGGHGIAFNVANRNLPRGSGGFSDDVNGDGTGGCREKKKAGWRRGLAGGDTEGTGDWSGTGR